MVQTKTIFLASSSELEADRREFELQVGRRNKDWVPKGVQLRLEQWEDFLDVMTRDGLQQAYNRVIEDCDLFVMLYWTKVGKYTREEFETASRRFRATNKPLILTYFKDAPISTRSANLEDLASLRAFQDKLKELGHYQTDYTNTQGLLLHFSQQLDKLVANGFIKFEPSAEPAGPSYRATLTGSGAIAQGPGAMAAGAGAVVIGGSNRGSINTGTQTRIDTGGAAYVGGNVRVTGGDFVGRDQISSGSSPNELESLFESLLKAVKEQSPPAVQAQASAKVVELKAEVQKDRDADDGKLAGIVEGLVGMVPGAIGSVVRMFASPILAGLIGPVTKYVLGKFQ